MIGTRLEMSARQEMKLAPRMILTLKILQLPIAALQERIESELQTNPVLELRDTVPDRTIVESPTTPEPEFDPNAPLDLKESNDAEFERLEALDRELDGCFSEEHRPSRNRIEEEGEKKLDAMSNMASRPVSLQDHLAEQLNFLDLPQDLQEMVLFLIANLDMGEEGRPANGYLTTPLSELVHIYPHGVVAIEDLEDALDVLQKLDPPGIGARDLKECLLLQITPEMEHPELMRQLILHHLEDIQYNRIPVIQKRTGHTVETIMEAIEQLRHLDPKPATRFHEVTTHYVTPDIIIERTEDDNYSIRLTDDWMPNLRISPRYIQMYKNRQNDKGTRKFLRDKIQSAEWLRDAILQRRQTLEKVTRAIIDHQRLFLDKGPDFIQPLKMQQIADQVGVHVTTVSRAVDDKWVQTPRGVFPLKRFFVGGKTNEETGENFAWEKVKQVLLDMIAQENKSNPLSDEEIVEKFKEAGYTVARRTVTKYRKLLKIPSSRQRKQW
jgi:RNA polymerase sigma-54 factor